MSTPEETAALHAEAASATTDPARLAALAHEHPWTQAIIASNPAAYDGLLDWIAQYGDAGAQDAVNERRNGLTVRVASPAVASAAPAAPVARKPLPKKALIFGGVGLVAAAVLAVGAIAVVNILGGGSGGAVSVASITSEPRDDAWTMEHPLVDESDGGLLYTRGYTVGQDQALVRWAGFDDESGSNELDRKLSLVNTKSGAVSWTVDWEADGDFDVVSAPGASPILVSVYDDEPELFSIDRGNGDVVSEASKLDSPHVVSYSHNGLARDLGGDYIIQSDDEVGRYSASDLTEPKWTVDLDDETVSVAGNRLVVDGTAYDLGSGEEVDWNLDDDYQVVDVDGAILASNSDEFGAFDQSGDEIWTMDIDDGTPAFIGGGVIVIADDDGESVTAYGLSDGEERWSADGDANGSVPLGGSAEAGVVFLALGDSNESTAFDLDSGEALYSIDLEDTGSTLLGLTAQVAYFSGDGEGDLVAIDTRTGDELWTLDNPKKSLYDYAVLGGQLVAYLTGVESGEFDSEPALRGLQP